MCGPNAVVGEVGIIRNLEVQLQLYKYGSRDVMLDHSTWRASRGESEYLKTDIFGLTQDLVSLGMNESVSVSSVSQRLEKKNSASIL